MKVVPTVRLHNLTQTVPSKMYSNTTSIIIQHIWNGKKTNFQFHVCVCVLM